MLPINYYVVLTAAQETSMSVGNLKEVYVVVNIQSTKYILKRCQNVRGIFGTHLFESEASFTKFHYFIENNSWSMKTLFLS